MQSCSWSQPWHWHAFTGWGPELPWIRGAGCSSFVVHSLGASIHLGERSKERGTAWTHSRRALSWERVCMADLFIGYGAYELTVSNAGEWNVLSWQFWSTKMKAWAWNQENQENLRVLGSKGNVCRVSAMCLDRRGGSWGLMVGVTLPPNPSLLNGFVTQF